MQDRVGIDLQLKENISAQLKVMLPMMERMQQHTAALEKLLYEAKGPKEYKQQLGALTQHMKAMGVASQELVRTEKRMDNLAKHTNRAAHQMGLLQRSLKGISGAPGMLAGMVGGFASIYTVGDMFKHGMDFEQQMKSLQLAGLNQKQLAAASKMARETSADPRFITTPTEVLEGIRVGTAITRDPDQAIGMAPLGAKFNRAMRQIHAPGADDRNLTENAYKMAEQLGIRTSDKMQSLMDDLTKVEIAFAGKVDLQKLTTQLAMTRTGKYGADVMPLLVQLSHVITEASGSGGSGGARAGVMYQAVQRAFHQGTMPQAAMVRLGQLGLINGYDDALAAKGAHKISARHGYLYDDNGKVVKFHGGYTGGTTGKIPQLTKGELGNLVITGLKDSALARQNFPQWVYKDLVPSISKKENVDFFKLGTNQQTDLLTKHLAGLQINAQDLIQQLVLQRKVFEGQLHAAQNAPNMEGVTKQQMSMRNHLNQLEKSWETFGTVLTSNDHIVSLFNRTMTFLSNELLGTAKYVDQLTNSLSALIHPDQTLSPIVNDVQTAAPVIGGVLADNANKWAHKQGTKLWHAGLDAVRHPAESIKNFLVPPPPPNVPSMVDMDRLQKYKDMALPDVHVTVNHETKLDSKTIAKHTTKHVAKALVKSGNKFSQSGSGASGSYTPSSLNAGGEGHQ